MNTQNMAAERPQMGVMSRSGSITLWVLVTSYLGARVLQIFPDRVPLLVIVSWHVILLALFALIHGALIYRIRGIVAFFALCLLIGNFFENLSIRTGFPFGHYHFTEVTGPKLFHVPVLLGVSGTSARATFPWTLGVLIMGNDWDLLKGFRLIALPMVAAELWRPDSSPTVWILESSSLDLGASAAGNLLVLLPPGGSTTVLDATVNVVARDRLSGYLH
jgi:uncharacterized membrane protein